MTKSQWSIALNQTIVHPGRRIQYRVFRTVLSLALAAAAAAAAAGAASDYPNRSIRMVAPFSAGGGADSVVRILAKRMGDELGEQVYVDNKGGASGLIGTEIVARAAPDGYTLGFVMSTHAINAATREKLRFDTIKSFAPVSLFASAPLVLVVSPSFPANTVQELVAAARSAPGKIDYASTGPASVPHIAGELFKLKGKVDLRHVGYKGVSVALNDVMAGFVPVTFQGAATVFPFVRSGKLRALGVTSPKRLPNWPDLPTLQEQGIADYDLSVWYGVLAPAGTPAHIVSKLNAAIQKIQRDPAVVAQLAELSTAVSVTSPEEFEKYLRSEVERYIEMLRGVTDLKIN